MDKEYYHGVNYPQYFNTSHWRDLKYKLIYSNKSAKCFICEYPYTLLIHHESYNYLFHERLYRDIFILCYNCHEQLHFYTFLFLFKVKTKLKRKSLRKRRLWLRLIICVRTKRFRLMIWYIFRYIINF